MKESVLFDLHITKINGVFTLHSEANTSIKKVHRPSWAIVLKYEGETVYQNNGVSYASNLENMIILPKGANYEWECTKSGNCYILDFQADEECDQVFQFPTKQGEKFLKLFKDAEFKNNEKRPLSKLETIKIAYSILLFILQSYFQNAAQPYLPTKKQDKIAPAVEFLEQNYTQALTNDELAAKTGLSTVYFRKLFTAEFGVSPIHYLHKLRIKKAKEMLKSDFSSLAEIADALGYLDICEFSKTFKRHVGIPPSQYAKKYSVVPYSST